MLIGESDSSAETSMRTGQDVEGPGLEASKHAPESKGKGKEIMEMDIEVEIGKIQPAEEEETVW